MGFKNVMKKGLFSGLNPMRWIGFEQIAGNAKTIKNLADGIVKASGKEESPTHPHSFEEAMQRYGLSEDDIKQRMRTAVQISVICLLLSIPMMGYAIYLFVKNFPLSAFVCIMLTLLLWAYAFREHFNYFQMKQRRLGCTFKEWFVYTVKGKGSR